MAGFGQLLSVERSDSFLLQIIAVLVSETRASRTT
jgi:hypothetical protein